MNASEAVPAVRQPELSWIVPMYRTAAMLPELLRRIDATVDELDVDAEVLLVDDDCPERSADRAEQLTPRTPTTVIRLEHNVGQDRALLEGLRRSKGRWAVLLDADLQDPPEAVTDLWRRRQSFDVLFAHRVGRYESPGRLLTSKLYRRAAELAGGLPRGAGLFVLVNRAVCDAVVALPAERFSMLAAIVKAGGLRTSVTVTRAARPSGHSSFSARARAAKGATTIAQLTAQRFRHRRFGGSGVISEESRQLRGISEQLAYYAARAPVGMRATDTPYVERHVSEVLQAAALPSGARVAEWGAGMGRFSRRLADHGFDVTAIELSPALAAECRDSLEGTTARVVVGDIAGWLDSTDKNYDAMVGFFVLHHLPSLAPYFRAARRTLSPGGRMVFVEPNPFNPLYPVQIAISPGMRWHAERGIYRLWPRDLERAARAAGFTRVAVSRYGLLPRELYNRAASIRSERWPERFIPPVLRAFQVVVAYASDDDCP